MKNKKGQEFARDFTIVIVLAIATAVILSNVLSRTESLTKNFGDIQIGILEVYDLGEKTLFYVDKSAEYSSQQTPFDLGEKGGFFEKSECGNYFGFELWQVNENNKIKPCFPDKVSVEDNFRFLFLEKLNRYFKENNRVFSVTIPLNNYDIGLKENLEITGIATRSIEIPIIPQKLVDLQEFRQQEAEEEEFEYSEDYVPGLVAVKDVYCTGSCKLTEDA